MSIEEKFRQINKLQEEVFDETFEYLPLYLKYTSRVDDGLEYLTNIRLSDGYLVFTGTETWGYGGREDYEISMPIRFVEDATYREKLKSQYEEKMRNKRLKEQEKQEQEKQKRRSMYEKLKKEFE